MTLHLAAALDGAGWHPAAWRAEGASPDALFTAAYWTYLVQEAERGQLDFVTFEDSIRMRTSPGDEVTGPLDAMLVATAVAPLTSRIGLVPASGRADLAAGIAALDRASGGRAGWQATGELRPRLPGRPLVTTLASDLPVEVAARGADIVFVTPHGRGEAAVLAEQARRAAPRVSVFADIVVFLGGPDQKDRLDDLDGEVYGGDAHVYSGSAAGLAHLLLDWQAAGVDGFRLRPAVLPHDLRAITRHLVPALRARGAFRPGYPAGDLRDRFSRRFARVS
ncbi:LLM class flavin-dependent oxidoreductase [Herbidospora mongoliensis]|uniref:LLM class flavin-dependent oxidoreductase n=1 Tax=Herbidospora mongoliensis TaxID=688067 RepID=UPI00083517BA|nr:LLM class flavin-dependent oxidoreductase [Herbidospora mongoliensis]